MKKLFRLFAGAALVTSLFAVNVHALGVEEGNNFSSTDVTVGSVDTPVYSVDLAWGDFSYDWSYNKETGVYEWKNSKMNKCGQALPLEAGVTLGLFPSITYSEEEYAEQVAAGNIYSDDTCTVASDSVAYADLWSSPVYSKYETESYQGLAIFDNSSFGQVVPSVSWNSGVNYEWTTGKFLYPLCDFSCIAVDSEELFNDSHMLYTDNACSLNVDKNSVVYQPNTYYTSAGACTTEELVGGELPDSLREFGGVNAETGVVGYSYHLNFELGVDSSKTITTPNAGDTIGTITVSFAAK